MALCGKKVLLEQLTGGPAGTVKGGRAREGKVEEDDSHKCKIYSLSGAVSKVHVVGGPLPFTLIAVRVQL